MAFQNPAQNYEEKRLNLGDMVSLSTHSIYLMRSASDYPEVGVDRISHMISVFIDHAPDTFSLTRPAMYYDLGDSYCTNPFWSNYLYRMRLQPSLKKYKKFTY